MAKKKRSPKKPARKKKAASKHVVPTATTSASAGNEQPPTRENVKATMVDELRDRGAVSPDTAIFVDELLDAVYDDYPSAPRRVVSRQVLSILAASHSGDDGTFAFTEYDLVYLAT